MTNSRIWIDMKNAHEPLFFSSIMKGLTDKTFEVTSRDYAELKKLLIKYKISNKVLGSHGGRNFFSKSFERVINRNLKLLNYVKDFDIALSFMSFESAFVGKLRDKKVISFTDNEIPQLYSKACVKFTDHLIVPSAIKYSDLKNLGLNKCQIHYYAGFKEDIYVADYIPNRNFFNEIPFKEYVVVRPEAYKAAYVSNNIISLVPKLVEELLTKNLNIIYLPRYEEDYKLLESSSRIFIPEEPLNGLDVCYHSTCVLTGSGTLAREAACLGVPAVSFFPEELLSVDLEMKKQNLLFHSRSIKSIIEFIHSKKKSNKISSRSKEVKKDVIDLLNEIIGNNQ